jgi:hypothetical protein
MNINEIADKINKLAKGRIFGSIQEVRYKHGIQPRTWNPFAAFSIKDEYAFHAGGRKELQFNIGQDYVNDSDVFRFGVAFSLNEDRTLHNSKAEFRPAIERLNKYFKENQSYFKGFQMWYYSQKSFAEYFDVVTEIDDTLFQAENFIFIGKYFEKKIDEIDESDLETIIDTFDYLMPLYELVQFGGNKVEKRIARLCWNDNGWIMPSGSFGKSINKDTHEAKFGYGHEEWLFDISKLIDGYHYGFLEPIRKQQDAYENKVFDAWLYSIDGATKKRYWIGEIKNLEVLNKDDAEKVKEEYINRGWFKEMEEQIIASGANTDGFSDWKGVDLFNIRFLLSNIKLNDPYFEIPEEHAINEQSRYSFAHFKEGFEVEVKDERDAFSFTLSDKKDEDEEDDSPKSKTHVREPKSVEIIYLHKAISKALTKELKKIYGKENVQHEHPAGYGATKIDIVVRDKKDLIFYEIKSYASLRTSIREAIGQLLEYSLWANHKKARQLIVVTQPLDDFDNAKIYFKHLRETFNLPLFYQSYDFENNILSEIV